MSLVQISDAIGPHRDLGIELKPNERSSVTVIDEWPMRDWIAFGCAPAAMANATLVWRRSWRRQFTPAFGFATVQKWVW